MNYYQKRKAEHKCVQCGKALPEDYEHPRCPECMEKKRVYDREVKKGLRALKICPTCGKNKLYGDEKICLECRDKSARYAAEQKPEKDAINNYHRSRYQILKNAGRCTRCGKPTTNGVRCKQCAELQNRKRRGTSDVLFKRIEQKLCVNCGKPVKPGYKVCQECYERNMSNLSKANATGNNYKKLANVGAKRFFVRKLIRAKENSNG